MAKALPLPVVQSGLESSIDQVRRNIKPINVPVNVDASAFKNLAQPLGRVSGLATEFEKSIAASNARVLAFGASVGIINGVQNAFASLLRTGIEVQKTLAEIAAISGQSGEPLSKFGDSLFEVGKLTGQSFKIAAQAALEFSRQGLSTEETLKRTTDALTLTRFTTLNASEAVDVLTAAANSFADTGITTTEILNKLVAVDTKFAVSAEDLANGLARAGSIAQEVGVSFDELNAAITIAQERTARGGSVIGNALKTIFTRLRSDETVQALRSIGVESLNAQGGLKGAIPLLEEVAQKLQGLSEGERIQILEAIASKYNINILSAILTDLSDANKKFGEVVGISAGAGNQAYERQVELNKALAAQINITTVSVEQLFNKLAEIGVTESLGNLLKFVNGLLDGINKILDSESTGGNIAKGLIKGISDIFFTVGLPLLGAIFIKLTKDIAQFGVESLKTILGINQQVRERQALEQAVVNTLIRDQEIMATILSLSGNRAKQEEYLLSVYNRQLAALQQVQSIAAGVAPALQAAGLSAASGTIKRRAAGGYLPAEEARDVRRGVGGASPSSKVVEIPNFSFGGGKRGTMVANTSEYIVPNYAGGSGTAVFNQDMVKQYGLPPGAKKITASGGFVPANGFVPNFVNFNVKRPQINPSDAEKIKKGGIDYINLVGTEPSAYLTLAKDPDGAMIGRFSELQQTAKEKIENVFGKNKVLPSATVQGQDNVLVKQVQSSYKTEAGVVKPTFNNAGTLVGKIFDYKKAIKKKDTPAAEQLIKDISFGLVPETSGALDQDVRQKFQEKIKTEIERDQNPVFAAGKILENSLFASIQRQVVNDNNRTWDLPSQISEEFKNAFGISNKVKFAEVKLGKTEKSMSSFLGKHIMSPSGTNASKGYIPNFALPTPEELDIYKNFPAAPFPKRDEQGRQVREYRSGFWVDKQRGVRITTDIVKNTLTPQQQASLLWVGAGEVDNLKIVSAMPSDGSIGAAMLVPDPAMARQVNAKSMVGGTKTKTKEAKDVAGFVKFRAFGFGGSAVKNQMNKMAEGDAPLVQNIRESMQTAIEQEAIKISALLKPYTFAVPDAAGFREKFKKQPGAAGAVGAAAGAAFEAAMDYAFVTKKSKASQEAIKASAGKTYDVLNFKQSRILQSAFGVDTSKKGGVEQYADFKISAERDDEFADQVILNRTFVDYAESLRKSREEAAAKGKASSGYIPNFASQNAIDAMRRIVSDPAAPQGEKDAAASKLAQLTATNKSAKTNVDLTRINPEYFEQQKKNYAYYMGLGFTKDASLNVLQGVDRARGTSTIDQLPKLKTFKQKNPLLFTQLETFVKQPNGRTTIEKILKDNSALSFQEPEKSAARGFVPSFAANEPLKEAINREVAAGVSPARVRVTQDDRLQNSKNPEGLAVINTRDEPNGKIPNNFRKRAAIQEVASAGFVPNFAKESFDIGVFGKTIDKDQVKKIQKELNNFAKELKAGNNTQKEFNAKGKEVSDRLKLTGATLDKYNAELKILGDAIIARRLVEVKAATATAAIVPPAGAVPASAAPAAAPSAGGPPAGVPPVAGPAGAAPSGDGKSGKGLADSTEKTKVGLDKMFYALSGITTLSYTLQSVFKDSESAVAKFTVGVASAAQTASQFALLGGGVRELADSFKLGEKGGVLGKLGKASEALPIAGAVIGAGVGIYQAFADAEQRDRDKRISEVQKDYTRRVSLEEVGLEDQEKLQAAQKRLQDRRKEEADAEKELQRKLNDPSRLKNQKDSVADVRKRLEARKEEARIEEANVKGAQDAVDTNKKRSDRSASRNTAELEKRAVLEKELGKLSEAFSKAENDALLSRVKNRIKINEQVLLGTQYQKEEAAFQIKLGEFENQKQDAKRSSLETTLKELASISSLANVDKAALEILMAKIRANGSLAGLEKEINALQGDGILKAKSILDVQTSTLNRTLASIDARKTEASLLDAQEKKSKAILEIEQLITQSIADRIKNVDEARSASLANEAESAGLQRQLRVKRIEDKIAGQPFATQDQKLALLKAQTETRQEEDVGRVRQAAAVRLQGEYVKLREEITRQVLSLGYLDQAYRKQFAIDVEQANNIENITERFAKLKEIRDRVFNQKVPQLTGTDKYFEFGLNPRTTQEFGLKQLKTPEIEKYLPKESAFTADFLQQGSSKVDEFAFKIEKLPSKLNDLGSLIQDSFSFNQPTKDLEVFLARESSAEARQKVFQGQKENAENNIEMLLKQQEDARKKNNALDVMRIELAIKALTYEQKIEEIRTRSQAAAGFTRAFDDLDKEAQGFTEKFSYDTTFAFRDGLRDALGAAISQTDDLNGALQAVALNFLKTMQNALLNNAVNTLMIGAGNAFPGVFGGLGKAKGGYIKGYASGGLVTGGSGYKDDVPAMLNGGEYVIRKSSVEKYGASNLQKLNSGDAPKFAAGGIFLPGVRGGTAISGYKDLTAFAKQTTTSGATDILMGGRSTAFASLEDQSARLSSYALLNEDDTINREIRSAQEQGLNLISEREKYRTQKRKAYQKQLVGTAISAALSFGLSKAFDTGVKSQVLSKQDYTPGGPTMTPYKVRGAYGGLIKTYSTGGGPTDNIPALLMDGEYVMSRKATSKYGKQFFDSINQGRAPRFADGGQVSTSEPSFAEKASAMSDSKATGGTNVSININVTGQSSQMQTEGETKDKGINYKEMSKQIEQIVLKTIAEQKRAGGMLKSGR